MSEKGGRQMPAFSFFRVGKRGVSAALSLMSGRGQVAGSPAGIEGPSPAMNAVRKLSATPDLPELPGNDEE
jgi:hypothetical protein